MDCYIIYTNIAMGESIAGKLTKSHSTIKCIFLTYCTIAQLSAHYSGIHIAEGVVAHSAPDVDVADLHTTRKGIGIGTDKPQTITWATCKQSRKNVATRRVGHSAQRLSTMESFLA